MNKPIILIVFLILSISILFGAKTVLSNKLSTTGLALGQLQDDVKKYKTQNTLLKEEIYTLSSLSHISSAAAELGFVESKDNYALAKSRPIAIRQ